MILCCFFLSDNNLSSEKKQEEKDKECPASMAKTFVVAEMYEAKLVSCMFFNVYFYSFFFLRNCLFILHTYTVFLIFLFLFFVFNVCELVSCMFFNVCLHFTPTILTSVFFLCVFRSMLLKD